MSGPGVPELLLVLFIVLLLFGAPRLPALGGALDRTIREFRRAVKEIAAGLVPLPEP